MEYYQKTKIKKSEVWDSVFKTIRQPEWWKGDSDYHPAPPCEPVSDLEKRFRAGEFVVATEVTPPLGAGTDKLIRDIEFGKAFCNCNQFYRFFFCPSKNVKHCLL